jgi:hypothetical protein
MPVQLNDLVAPADVCVPPLDVSSAGTPPPFTSEVGWLESTVESIWEKFESEDSGSWRVPPMALVRCSRGGKTRALKEIARRLKKERPEVCVLYVSLNDFSSIETKEQVDPTGALCRRIAFSAMKGQDFEDLGAQFGPFLQKSASQNLIRDWLGQSPCVLLVDELNNLKSLERYGDESARECAFFLKKMFLNLKNRYLVFSSHVVSTTLQLSTFMESSSSREVILRTLPVIPKVTIAAQNFKWTELNAREVLYYGRVPALVHEARLDSETYGNIHLPNQKRREALKRCQDLVTDEKMILLLQSFLDGRPNLVPEPLHQLMDSCSLDKIRWIPFHMMEVLQSLSLSCSQDLRLLLRHIVELFDSFKGAKNLSGDGWESLFVIVLLIRSVSGMFDNCLLPLREGMVGCKVFFNRFLDLRDGKSFEDICEVQDLVNRMEPPQQFPSIVVYYPSHNSFKLYDAVVAAYDRNGSRQLFGYQLKEGKEIPRKLADDDLLIRSYVVRGQAAQLPKELRKWTIVSEQEIEVFLGESGMMWTPSKWKDLKQ